MLRLLLGQFDEVLLTRYLDNPRAVPPEELQAIARELTGREYPVFGDPAAAWDAVRRPRRAGGPGLRHGVVLHRGRDAVVSLPPGRFLPKRRGAPSKLPVDGEPFAAIALPTLRKGCDQLPLLVLGVTLKLVGEVVGRSATDCLPWRGDAMSLSIPDFTALQQEVRDLRAEVERIQGTIIVPINSFAPEPLTWSAPSKRSSGRSVTGLWQAFLTPTFLRRETRNKTRSTA